jgi:hypothetical protein
LRIPGWTLGKGRLDDHGTTLWFASADTRGSNAHGRAILVVGVASLLLLRSITIPRFTTTGPVVRNGVAVIVACGKKRGFLEATDYAPEARTGTWGGQRKGECNVYYHNPPDWHQREQRHLRAS